MTKADRREREILIRAAARERSEKLDFSMTGISFTWWWICETICGERTAQIIESAAYAWSDGP